MSRFTKLKDQFYALEVDFVKFYDKGNKTASVRLRRGLGELRKEIQNIRAEIIEIKRKAKEVKDAG